MLPRSEPDITLDHESVCNLCRKAEKESVNPEEPLHETDFLKMINKYRGRYKYDCLVMCSGGKDSTSSLYFMKEKYRLNPLAFTFDHGFETEDAMENVRRAVEKLGVDFLFIKTDYMKDIFARMICKHSRAVICHPCSIWYMDLTFDIARRFEIPIIIAGWTKGQATRKGIMSKCACSVSEPEYASMAEATRRFLATLKDDPVYKGFPTSMEEVLTRARKRHRAMVLSPHWFLQMEPEEYVAIIKRELDWEYPRLSYPKKSTNCYMNFLSVHFSMKHYGFTHYHIEMSKLIRQGLMTREEALDLLEINYDLELLNRIASKLGCKVE